MKRFKKITVLKPDHLGDLVLSMPAIRHMMSNTEELSLYVSPGVVFLAKYLFGEAKIDIVDLAHLSKSGDLDNYDSFLADSANSDLVVFLRNDVQTVNLLFNEVLTPKILVERSDDIHETELQRLAIKDAFGDYDPLSFFPTWTAQAVNVTPHANSSVSIGLCVSAGFINNSLSLGQWVQIGNDLRSQLKADLFLIGGPSELKMLQLLQKLLHLPKDRILIGSQDIDLFLTQLKKLKFMISTDSGTAHIASLGGTPQLSIFGPSPSKRYSPVGRNNEVLSRRLNCSPCPQFTRNEVNLCVSRECLAGDWTDEIKRAVYLLTK